MIKHIHAIIYMIIFAWLLILTGVIAVHDSALYHHTKRIISIMDKIEEQEQLNIQQNQWITALENG